LKILTRIKAAVPFGVARALHKIRAAPLPPAVYSFQLIRRYLVGRGLEIGPGRYPYCAPKRTTFVEKHPEASDGMTAPDVIAEASDLPFGIETQDYVFSSHVLEHVPNTIKTLNEWLRVLKPRGILFLLLPCADHIFDRHRARTTLEHHIRDFQELGDGPDHSHDDEARAGWERLEDLEKLAASHLEAFGTSLWDFEHRIAHDAMHYHVWTQNEIVRLLQYLGLEIVAVVESIADRADTFAVVARKSKSPPAL
jgi:SAM-dependent methyltransferase